MRTADRPPRPLAALIALLLGLTLLGPSHDVAADGPGTPCQGGGWAWMAPAVTPDIAFLSEEACASAIAGGVKIVPITIPPDGPPPIGSGVCVSDDCYTVDRDGDGVPDFRDAAPDDPAVTISADCERVMANRALTSFANLNLASCDLSGRVVPRADFSGANLAGANLTTTHLADANLTGANLDGANLTRTDLTRAILVDATLNYADLTGANLTGAYLVGADMGSVNLAGAILTRANLTGAFLDRSTLEGATLIRANLTGPA
jgi:hypothetical protein